MGLLLVGGCATVPYTNRKQLSLVSEGEENQMGLEAYKEVKSKNKISTDPQINAMVQRVGKRIAAAADQPDWDWQFTVIDDPKTINAFCLPGGRIAVYTGILPLTRDENGLAVVLGHETSHALAHHGAERMSEAKIMGAVEEIASESGVTGTTLQTFNLAYGVGRGLPHSRKQESEADHIGLILMAKAGYDPRHAVDFWERMAKEMQGKAPPAFLSDHPSDAQRINKIREELPEALQYYKP